MLVLETVLADQAAPLRQSAHILVTWYNLTRLTRVGVADLAALRAAGTALRDNWHQTFHDTGIKSLTKIAKLHRLEHVGPDVERYGPFLYLTTESSEAAHKRFKAMYRTCVTPSFVLSSQAMQALCCACLALSTLLHVPHDCIKLQ